MTDQAVPLPVLDGLDAEDILAIGWEQLRLNHEQRAAAAREIDASAPELDVEVPATAAPCAASSSAIA